MGIPGSLTFKLGIEKTVYNNKDSYILGGLGQAVIEWAHGALSPENLPATIASVENLRVVRDTDAPPTDEERQQFVRFADFFLGVDSRSWYALLRKLQPSCCGVDDLLAAGIILHDHRPPYGVNYIVDFENEELVITASVRRKRFALTFEELTAMYPPRLNVYRAHHAFDEDEDEDEDGEDEDEDEREGVR